MVLEDVSFMERVQNLKAETINFDPAACGLAFLLTEQSSKFVILCHSAWHLAMQEMVASEAARAIDGGWQLRLDPMFQQPRSTRVSTRTKWIKGLPPMRNEFLHSNRGPYHPASGISERKHEEL